MRRDFESTEHLIRRDHTPSALADYSFEVYFLSSAADSRCPVTRGGEILFNKAATGN